MVLQNPFPATLVFSQLSALLPGCYLSLPLLSPFRHGARQPAGSNLATPAHPVACGLFISLASLLRRRSVYFQSFADSFCKTPGGGVSLVLKILPNGTLYPLRKLFARCSCTLYPQSRLHPRF